MVKLEMFVFGSGGKVKFELENERMGGTWGITKSSESLMGMGTRGVWGLVKLGVRNRDLRNSRLLDGREGNVVVVVEALEVTNSYMMCNQL